MLLLHAGHVVSTDFLIDAALGRAAAPHRDDVAPELDLALRKLLGAGPARDCSRPAIVLAVDPESIDLARFERLVASRAVARSPRSGARTLREALALWRGEPLPDFAFEPFAQPEIRRLEELRLRRVEERIDAELEPAEPRRTSCRSSRRSSPSTRSASGCAAQLMLALYRSGRQAEALDAYQDAAARARDELGLEPSPQLQRAARADPPAGGARPAPQPAPSTDEQHFEEVADGRARRPARAGARHRRRRRSRDAARAAVRAIRTTARELARVAQFVALTKGSGPLYDELHALLERRRRADAGAPLLRVAAAAAARARRCRTSCS